MDYVRAGTLNKDTRIASTLYVHKSACHEEVYTSTDMSTSLFNLCISASVGEEAQTESILGAWISKTIDSKARCRNLEHIPDVVFHLVVTH